MEEKGSPRGKPKQAAGTRCLFFDVIHQLPRHALPRLRLGPRLLRVVLPLLDCLFSGRQYARWKGALEEGWAGAFDAGAAEGALGLFEKDRAGKVSETGTAYHGRIASPKRLTFKGQIVDVVESGSLPAPSWLANSPVVALYAQRTVSSPLGVMSLRRGRNEFLDGRRSMQSGKRKHGGR